MVGLLSVVLVFVVKTGSFVAIYKPVRNIKTIEWHARYQSGVRQLMA